MAIDAQHPQASAEKSPQKDGPARLRRPFGSKSNPSFSDIVRHRIEWGKAKKPPPPAADKFVDRIAAFLADKGEIVEGYWGTHRETAVILTSKPAPRLGRFLGAGEKIRLYHEVE